MSKLISGKEAYFAIGEGLIVQKSYDPIGNGLFGEWEDLDPSVFNIYGMLKDSGNDPQFRFRLKPRTITLNGIEVPAPLSRSAWKISTLLTELTRKAGSMAILQIHPYQWEIQSGAPKKKSNKLLQHCGVFLNDT